MREKDRKSFRKTEVPSQPTKAISGLRPQVREQAQTAQVTATRRLMNKKNINLDDMGKNLLITFSGQE